MGAQISSFALQNTAVLIRILQAGVFHEAVPEILILAMRAYCCNRHHNCPLRDVLPMWCLVQVLLFVDMLSVALVVPLLSSYFRDLNIRWVDVRKECLVLILFFSLTRFSVDPSQGWWVGAHY